MTLSIRTCTITLTLIATIAIPRSLLGQRQPAFEEGHHHHHYKLIDLGTFGGSASYFPNGLDGFFNDQGIAAGWANTSTPDPYPAFCFTPSCFVSHAFQWRDGSLKDLGTLPGGSSSQAFWISSNGLIIGTSQNGEIDPLIPGLPENRAVLWQHGHIVDLGTLDGGYESLGSAVNDRGQVVGIFNNTIPDPFSMIGDGYQARAFLWQNGEMQDLGTLGGPDAVAVAVDEEGQIAGLSYTNSTPNAVTGYPTQDPVLWTDGKIMDLGTLGGTAGYPTGFNDRGEVIGQSNVAGDLNFHPFLWTKAGGIQDLDTFGGNNGTTNWINNRGEIAGKADLPGTLPQTHDGFLWRNGAKIDLGTLPGDSCSNAYFVNSRGQVVGTSEDQEYCFFPDPVGQRAFLWEEGGPMIDRNTLIPPDSGLQLTYAVAINDSGEIAGFGVPKGVAAKDYEQKGHAFVLVPCDRNDADCDR
jgi:probable HAF family extracellular repeat protein